MKTPNIRYRRSSKRVFVAIVLWAAALFFAASAFAQTSPNWVGTWATGPEMPSGMAPWFENETLRQIMHVSVGGNVVRVRISNTYGDRPLVIASASVAVRTNGSAIDSATSKPLTFAGQRKVAIPAGAVWISDPVEMRVAPLSDVAVSLFFDQAMPGLTMHGLSFQTNYRAKGDLTAASTMPPSAPTFTNYFFVSGIEVVNSEVKGVVVALGDSITDGASAKSDVNHRWPNFLAESLQKANQNLGVLNVGISGNRLLHDSAPNGRFQQGAAALARFDSDVLAQSGVTHLVVLEGINDIGHPGQSAPMSEDVSAEEMIAALRQIATRAHSRGIKVYACTILPFEGTPYPGYYTPEKDLKRRKVNDWIRQSKEFDGIVDTDKAMADPAHPSRMRAEYDSGDHLHPGDAGQKAIADAVVQKLL